MTQLLSDSKVSSMVISMVSQPPPNMTTFFAIPGASGKVRLKLEMSEDANFVMIRYKTSAWASGDGIATGTLVTILTDNYNLANEWYEVSGLTNGTAYYFKAFPYNESYNSTIGENETVCKAGGLVMELTMDSISGSTVNDTSGNENDSTLSGISFGTGTIGNKAYSTSANQYITMPTIFDELYDGGAFEFTMIFSAPSTFTNSNLMEMYQKLYIRAFFSDTDFRIQVCDSSHSFVPNVDASETCFLAFGGTPSSQFVSKNNGTKSTNSGTPYTGVDASPRLFTNRAGTSGMSGAGIDQFRVWNRVLEDYERANIYNGGDGC